MLREEPGEGAWAEAGGALAFGRASTAAAKSLACLHMKIRQDGLYPRTSPAPGPEAAGVVEGRFDLAAHRGSA